jgi:hypothetical protein
MQGALRCNSSCPTVQTTSPLTLPQTNYCASVPRWSPECFRGLKNPPRMVGLWFTPWQKKKVTELMAALSAQQPVQTQVRLQLSTRDEGLVLPQPTGPILVPTCERPFQFFVDGHVCHRRQPLFAKERRPVSSCPRSHTMAYAHGRLC